MNFIPLGKRVLVQRTEEATTTSSGIIIPDNTKEKPSSGVIVAVSDTVSYVSIGDGVVFSKFSGSEIKVDGTQYLIILEDDLFGIIKKV